MSRRILALAIVAVVLAACGGTSTQATPTPGGGDGGATATPAETQGGGETTPPNVGDIEGKVRALAPAGCTEVGTGSFGGAFQLTCTTTTSIADLEAFWDQKIPSLGMTLSGKFTVEDTLTIAITNPDGGIVAARDASTGQTTIVISLGTSS